MYEVDGGLLGGGRRAAETVAAGDSGGAGERCDVAVAWWHFAAQHRSIGARIVVSGHAGAIQVDSDLKETAPGIGQLSVRRSRGVLSP
jgi:hypothetical protein